MRVVAAIALVVAVAAVPAWGGDGGADAAPKYEGKTAPEWTKQLVSEDVKLRQKAAYALWKLGPDAKDAASALAKAIRDEDAYVRTTAAKAIFRLDREAVKPALPELASELGDSREEVRREAITIFYRLGALAAEVVPQLTTALSSTDPVVRANAAASLGNAGEAARPALPAITKALDDEAEEVRKWAAKAIAQIDVVAALASTHALVRLTALQRFDEAGPPDARAPGVLAAVLKNVDDPDEQVRGWAVHTLDSILPRSEEPLKGIAVFQRVLEKDRSPAARAAAAFALGRYAGHGRQVVPLLVAAATSSESEVRCAALLALGWLKTESRSAVPLLVELLRSPDQPTREAASVALGSIGDTSDGVIAALVGALQDQDPYAHRAVINAIGAVGKGSPRVAPALVAYLVVKNADERHQYLCGDCVSAIASAGCAAEALPALTSVFEKDPNAARAVAFALCALDSEAAPKAFVRLTGGLGEKKTPQDALALLRLLGPKGARATPLLVPLLRSDDGMVRGGAAVALGAFGPAAKDALPALEQMLQDPDKQVAATAKQAIEEIRGPVEVKK